MVRFRSGNAGVNAEKARWEGEEHSTICACDSGVDETVEHVLLRCELYNSLRVEWYKTVEGLLQEKGRGSEEGLECRGLRE